jgi:hypothetical protein
MSTQTKEISLKSDEQRGLAEEILAALKGLRYGSVEITVHDHSVVQIDRHERHRVTGPGKAKTE